jgi:hypothetical protein
MELETDLGIRTLRGQVWDGKRTYNALNILVVFPGSTAQLAGIQRGEVIVIDGTVDDFYESLELKRGGTYNIDVAAAPVGGSIEKNPRRSVTITVPK